MGTVNFDNIPKNDFEPLPEDRYSLECLEAKLAESKAGNPKISAQFKVVGGDYNNRRIFNDFSLVPAAWFNLKNYLEAAGVEVNGEIEFEEIPKMLIGTQTSAFVTIEVSKYKGEERENNRVGLWKSVGSGNEPLFK